MTEVEAFDEDEDEDLDGEPTPAGAVARICVGPWRPELDDDELYPELQLWLLDDEGWVGTIYNEDASELEVPMDFAIDADPAQVAAYLVEVLEGRVPLES